MSSDHVPAVEISHVYFRHHPHEPLLEGVSLRAYAGELIGIIGPNGSGKSTLLKLLLGLLDTHSGTIRICGCKPKDAQRHMSYVPQTTTYDRLFPICVREVVMMGLLRELGWFGGFGRCHRQRAEAMLERIGLLHLANSSFGTLSGGQAQRVLLARALISKPAVLLLDEPTASADPHAVCNMLRLIGELAKECTVLMVTHDVQIAQRHAQRIMCVQGSVRELRPDDLCHHYAQGLYHSATVDDIPLRPTLVGVP